MFLKLLAVTSEKLVFFIFGKQKQNINNITFSFYKILLFEHLLKQVAETLFGFLKSMTEGFRLP